MLLKRTGTPLVIVALVVGAAFVVLHGQARRPNVLLITLDTVRADHLGSYGFKTGATPALDRMAREGVRFTDATANAPLTGPAHAALLTGVYPARYGMRDNVSTTIPPTTRTLAEALKSAGYSTGGFVAAFILDGAYGFDHGFDRFDSNFKTFEAQDKMRATRTADEVLKPTLGWLGKVNTNQPFFCWIHFYDAHTPYTPPPPYRTTFRTHPYDGEIAYVDSAIAKLLAALQQKGVLDQTLVVAIGDHGESLGEHGEAEHGLFLYDSVLHIPWLMRLPGKERAGSLVTEQVRSVDLMPTVLELVGLQAPKGLDGESLAGPVRGRPRRDLPPSYAESFYGKLHHGWSETYSLRVGEWKLIDAPKSELYDLRTDKKEATNVLDRQANVAGRLNTDLRQTIAGLGPGALTKVKTPDRETMERLRSLGYVGFAGSIASGTRGPDPKDMIKQLEEFNLVMLRAQNALKRQQPEIALANLKRALAIDDKSYDVHLTLGDTYTEMRRYDQALGEYEAAALINPDNVDPILACVKPLLAQGKTAQASQKVDQASVLAPESFEIAFNRGLIAEQQGHAIEALDEYQRAVQANPSDARSKARLANIAMVIKRWDIATPMLTSLLEMGYQPSRSHYGLGQAAEARGDRATAINEYRQAVALEPGFAAAKQALARVSGK